MSNPKKPVTHIHPSSLAAEIAEQDAREALFNSVVADLGGAAFEAELNSQDPDAAIARLIDGIARSSFPSSTPSPQRTASP